MGELTLALAPRTTHPTVSARTRWTQRVALGTRITNARVAARMTLADLAGELTSVAYLSRLEAGERLPSRSLLEDLADRLHTDATALTGGESQPADGLRFELAHADLLVAAGHFDDAARVTADLAEIAACIGATEIAHAAKVLRAYCFAGTGQYRAALRTVRPLGNGPMALLATVAQTRFQVALSHHRRAIDLGRCAADLMSSTSRASLPEVADLALSVCTAHSATGDRRAAAQVARSTLKQLLAGVEDDTFELPGSSTSLAGVSFRSLGQATRQTEVAIAGLQAAKLRADIEQLRSFTSSLSDYGAAAGQAVGFEVNR